MPDRIEGMVLGVTITGDDGAGGERRDTVYLDLEYPTSNADISTTMSSALAEFARRTQANLDQQAEQAAMPAPTPSVDDVVALARDALAQATAALDAVAPTPAVEPTAPVDPLAGLPDLQDAIDAAKG